MQIAGREISSRRPPYIVAEIGGNHAGKLEHAIALMDAAKAAGADACKFQCFQADRITLDCDKPDFILKDGPWAGRKLYDLYTATETPREWFPTLFAHGKEIGITAFSSVFSPEDIDFLEGLDCPAYKIASFEITDIPLIEYAAKTGKPLIISTGMVEREHIEDRASKYNPFNPLRWGWEDNTALLHCVSGYPTPIEEASLGFGGMKSLWLHCPLVGISDHTLGWEVPVAATALGATIIEKHIKLTQWLYHDQEELKTEDSAFSMDDIQFKYMCEKVRAIWQAMQPSERKSEASSKAARRSLYVVKDIKPGEPFTTENVRSIRPVYGMPPKELPRVLKNHAACYIERGTALEEGMLVPF